MQGFFMLELRHEKRIRRRSSSSQNHMGAKNLYRLLHQNRTNMVFSILFTLSSIALVVGSWLHILPFSLVEDLGFITGALTVWLTVVENIWNFPIGIANDVFFFVLFWQVGLFADMGLQVIYVLLGFQGWYLWLHGGKNKTALKVSSVSPLELLILLLITIAATTG